MSAHARAVDRVLIIHSYHAEFAWVQNINQALEAQLRSAEIPYQIFYMDTKRRSGSAWKKKAAQQASRLITEYKPRVVIAIDDNAQAFVVQRYVNASPIQFIFAGVNAEPKKYGYPAKNVTGILERTYPSQVLKLLERIMPTSVKVAWVSDDSETANLILRRVRKMATTGNLPLPILEYALPVTFEQWKETIRKYDTDARVGGLLIPLYHTVKTHAGGQSVPASDVMRWTVTHTRKPVVGFWPFSVDDGAICAVVVDPKEHGQVAGLMAKQVISGKNASDLPMVVNTDGYVILNIAAAGNKGIDVPFEVILSADKIIE